MARSRALIAPAIAVLASTPAVMRALLEPLSDDLIAAPGRDAWSARDVVAHLALRQRPAIIGRIEAILAQENAAIPDIPDDLMHVEPQRNRPLDALLREFDDGRAECVKLLESITDDQLQRRGVHSGVGELSIADIVHHVAYHDLVHVSQAAQLTAAPLEPLRGRMRAFR